MKIFLICLLSSVEFFFGVILGVYLTIALVLHQEILLWLLGVAVVIAVIFDLLYEFINWRIK